MWPNAQNSYFTKYIRKQKKKIDANNKVDRIGVDLKTPFPPFAFAFGGKLHPLLLAKI